jgi:predicted dehydrogenase
VVGTRYGEYDVDDDAILLISWSQGTNSLVESGWWHPHAGGSEADTEVFGTAGYGRIFPPGFDDDVEDAPMYVAQMHAFFAAIEGGRSPSPSGEDGRVVIDVVERAYASAAGS